MRKMGIERRRDAPHQKFRAVSDGEPVIVTAPSAIRLSIRG
jgi:hypothetical protein